MFKKSIFNFEFKVIALMLVTFVFVVVTGFVAYYRFSTILENISNSVRPDSRLVLSHSLKNDLAELSNIAKTHSLTEDNSYRKNYILIRNNIWEKLDEFRNINDKEDNEIDMDLLDSLIQDRLIVLDGIMYSEDPFRVQTALGKVVLNIETSDEDIHQITTKLNQNRPVESTSSARINEEVDLKSIKTTSDQLETLDKEEGKLLKKRERAEKRNKTERLAELDSMLEKRKKEARDVHRKLTKAEEHEKEKMLAINQIYRGIENVSTEELLIEKEIKSVQLGLISMDNLLGLRISKMFDEFELVENKKFAIATKKAEAENEKTNDYAAIFSVFVAILLLLIAYIVIQYVKKNNLYKTALKRSTSETEKLVKTREKLIATISHEIRTPMHAIAGFAEQLSKEQLNKKQSEYVSMIRKSSEHLTYLVNDVLDLTKLQNGKLKLNMQPFNLKELIHDVELYSKELVQDNRLVVSSSIEEQIASFYLGDIHRLRQILLNLMSNAVKFTETGSVHLNVAIEEQSPDSHLLKITVEDTGIGMTEKDLEKVFIEFEQFGTRANNNISGTGLGLSITKRLIQLHNGKINIESEKGKGTLVELIMPLELASAPEKKRKVIVKKEIACQSILVVDDEAYNRKLLKAMFKPYSVTLLEAENGKEALEKLQQHPVDLILLDARMPVMDGKNTIEALKQMEDETKRNVKVILLTAAGAEMEDVLDQVSGYVSKPFSEEQLIGEITKIFDTKKVTTESVSTPKEETETAIDFNNLRALSGTDTTFYVDMLNTFVTTTTASMENMNVAFSNKDWELIANEAHKIASPCRHLGAIKMHTLLKDIEKNARDGQNTKTIKNKMKALEKEVGRVLQLVQQELTTIN
jgi:signal transduction histidine kinase/DNA-binding response OmpR family regulator